MAIKVGDRIPSATLKELTPDGIKDVKTDDLFANRKVVLFAVPGAFTPLCSAQHLPGYVTHADALKKKGVDEVVCMAMNDPFVMDAWCKDRGAVGKVRLVSDGNGELTKALGLGLDASGFGMGQRSQRYAMIVQDGTVKELMVEPGPGLNASSAESVLGKL